MMRTRFSRIVVVIAVLALQIALFAAPASAHRSGCHRWHSCPSDTGSYTCGDLGYSTYCGGSQTTTPTPSTAGAQPQGNPPPDWTKYEGWPFTQSAKKGDPILFLLNYSNRVFAKSVAPGTGDTLTLQPAQVKATALSNAVTIHDFGGNSPDHSTRLVERKGPYSTSKWVVGRFANRTPGPIQLPSVAVYRQAGSSTQRLASSYVYPSTLLPGQVGYYEIWTYGVEQTDTLAVGVTDWLQPTTGVPVHRFPVTDITWKTEGEYVPTLKVSAKVNNDTDTDVTFVDILVIIKDKFGQPLHIAHWFVTSIGARGSEPVIVSVADGFEGMASIEVLAYKD